MIRAKPSATERTASLFTGEPDLNNRDARDGSQGLVTRNALRRPAPSWKSFGRRRWRLAGSAFTVEPLGDGFVVMRGTSVVSDHDTILEAAHAAEALKAAHDAVYRSRGMS